MNRTEIYKIIKIARRPIERNLVFRINLKNRKEVHGELSQWNPESSVAEIFDGEARTFNFEDILKAEPVSQAELLKVVSSLKDECDSLKERNETLLQALKMLSDSSKEVWKKVKLRL